MPQITRKNALQEHENIRNILAGGVGETRTLDLAIMSRTL